MTANEVRRAFRDAASKAPLKGVMDVLEQEWPSSCIVGDPHTSIIDLRLAQVLDEALVSVAAWYDNKYGCAARLAKMAERMAKATLPEIETKQQAPAIWKKGFFCSLTPGYTP